MLEHEGQVSDSPRRPIDPAATRITAEEFSAAVGRIEARRAEETAHRSGTIEIGSTLHELHIDATPEEVLREVERLRAEKARESTDASQAPFTSFTVANTPNFALVVASGSVFEQLRTIRVQYRHARREQERQAKIAYRLDRDQRLYRVKTEYIHARGQIVESFGLEIFEELHWAAGALFRGVANMVRSIQRSR